MTSMCLPVCSVAYAASDSFTVDGLTYRFYDGEKAEASNEVVQLYNIPASTSGALDIPEAITYEGKTYNVTSIFYNAISDGANITSIHIPASLYCNASLENLSSCVKLAGIEVDEGNPSFSSVDGVLYNSDKTSILCYPQTKTAASFTVPDTVKTIAAYSFYGNKHLESVSLPADLTGSATYSDKSTFTRGGICKGAFKNCTALKSVSFAKGAVLAHVPLSSSGTGSGAAIESEAFKGCTSLTSITIPPITSSKRKGDYYSANDTHKGEFTSGYESYWHNAAGPVENAGIGAYAFEDCTALETVVFQAGAKYGSYAYVSKSGFAFHNCKALKQVVCQTAQPYWMDTTQSGQNSTFEDYWYYAETPTPSLYYAVDYYATSSASMAKSSAEGDYYGSSRLARVEYLKGTKTSDIATNNASELKAAVASQSLYADSAYKDGDLSALDPNAVAKSLGYSGSDWVWRLSSNQYERDGISNSCYAYLAHSSDLSNAHAVSEKLDSERFFTDRHMDEEFNPARYYAGSMYSYATTFDYDTNYLVDLAGNELPTCWFTLDSKGIDLADLAVKAADGTVLSIDDFTLSYEMYDSATGKYVSTTPKKTAPYRVTFTSKNPSYAGSFTQWLLIRTHTAKVTANFNSDTAETSYASLFARTFSGAAFDAPYVVMTSSDEATSSILAASYAGLVQGGVQITSSATSLGRSILTAALTNAKNKQVVIFGNQGSVSSDLQTQVKSSGFKTLRFGSSGKGDYSAADIAVAAYEYVDDNASSIMGTQWEDYSWGDTAILCSAGKAYNATAVAAYAYQKKAPVFFLDDDGTLNSDAAGYLSKFKHVLVVGDSSVVSNSAVSSIKSDDVQRLDVDANDACGVSLAFAKMLLKDETLNVSMNRVSICDGNNASEVTAAQNFTGPGKGITLVTQSVADSKRVVDFMRAYRDDVKQVEVFGRSASLVSGNGFDLVDSANMIWDLEKTDELSQACRVKTGDSLVYDGVRYYLSGDDTLTKTAFSSHGAKGVSGGKTLAYNGTTYKVTQVLGAQSITLKCKTAVTYKAKKLKKAKATLAVGAKAKGEVIYKLSAAATKAKMSITKAGKLTIKKGTKKGTYKVTVTAAETDLYPQAQKTITIKVK